MSQARTIPAAPLWVLGGLLLLVVLLVAFLVGQFHYVNVCVVCGGSQHGVDYQVPFTRWTGYSHRQQVETTLSRVLEAHQLVAAHEHNWQLVSGDGNGIPLLLGDGHLVATSLISPCMGPFMERMLELTDRETANGWVNRLRDPHSAHLCRSLAELSLNKDFRSRAEWEDWLARTEARFSPPRTP